MSVSATVLRELHRIHGQLADLRERQDRGPRQIKAREANVANFEAAHTAAQDSVKQTKKAIDQKQLDLRAGENRISDLKVKLNVCSSNKEYQALLEQIAASEMANSVLADEILEAMDKVDQLEAAVATALEHLEVARTELVKCRDAVAEEAALVQGDIERLERELTEAEKQVPDEIKEDYRRVIRSKGAEGMAPVEDGVCQACGNKVTLNMVNELLMSKPVFCRSCGCLLYTKES